MQRVQRKTINLRQTYNPKNIYIQYKPIGFDKDCIYIGNGNIKNRRESSNKC